MILRLTLLSFVLLPLSLIGQGNIGIGTNTPDDKAKLEIQATDGGMLIPRMTSAQRTTLSSSGTVPNGLMVYDTDLDRFLYWDESLSGGSGDWNAVAETADLGAWLTTGNGGTTAGTDFIGTTDAVDLVFKTNDTEVLRLVESSGDLQITNDVEVAGNDINGSSSGNSNLNIKSNGGVRIDLDDNNNGSSSFGIKNGSNSVVFDVTEAGSFTADGNGTIDGNLELLGNSRTLSTGTALDISGESGIDIIIDSDNNSSASEFSVKRNGTSEVLFAVRESGFVRSFPYGTGTGETGGFQLRELAANGTNSVSLRAPDTITTDVILTLPRNDGNSNEVLITDGSGELSFVDANTVVNNYWDRDGTNGEIYPATLTDEIGIGTTDPIYELDVRGYVGATNQITTVPLWQASSGYVMNNATGSDLSNCEAGFEGTSIASNGNVEVRLVIRIASTSGTPNFQLRTHDGTTETFPIVNTDTWTFSNTQTGQVAISPWKDWASGSNFHEIHLFGWNTGGSTTFNSAYLQVRPDQP